MLLHVALTRSRISSGVPVKVVSLIILSVTMRAVKIFVSVRAVSYKSLGAYSRVYQDQRLMLWFKLGAIAGVQVQMAGFDWRGRRAVGILKSHQVSTNVSWQFEGIQSASFSSRQWRAFT